MSIEIKSDILAKELNQGIVPLGVPKAYKYDAALVEAARAAVNQGIDDVAEAGDTAKAAVEAQGTASVNAVSAQEQASKADVNALGDKILAQMKHGYGYPFTAATAAAMTDTAKIYVYTGSETGYTNGNWYYWNGTAWTSGGVYNATALETDKTLTVSGAAADAKVVGDSIDYLQENISYGRFRTNNILDYENADIVNGFLDGALNRYSEMAGTKSVIVPVDSTKGTTVSIHRTVLSSRFMVASFTAYPTNGMAFVNRSANHGGDLLTLTIDESIKYILVWYYWDSTDSGFNEKDILKSLMVCYGKYHYHEPYYAPFSEKNASHVLRNPSFDFNDTIYLSNSTAFISVAKGSANPLVNAPEGDTWGYFVLRNTVIGDSSVDLSVMQEAVTTNSEHTSQNRNTQPPIINRYIRYLYYNKSTGEYENDGIRVWRKDNQNAMETLSRTDYFDSLVNYSLFTLDSLPAMDSLYVNNYKYSKGYVKTLSTKIVGGKNKTAILLIINPSNNAVLRKYTVSGVGEVSVDVNEYIGVDFYVGIRCEGASFHSDNYASLSGLNYFSTGVASDYHEGSIINVNFAERASTDTIYMLAQKVTYGSLYDFVSNAPNYKNTVIGNRMFAIGDSITAGHPSYEVGGHWWEAVARAYHYKVIPGGRSGAGISYYNGKNACTMTRGVDFTQYDVAIYAFGTNDYGNNQEIGSFSDTYTYFEDSSQTVYAALKYIIETIKTSNPKCTIIWSLPINRTDHGTLATNWGYGTANALGYTLDDYCEAIKTVCDYYGIAYIDHHKGAFDRYGVNSLLVDRLHPSTDGYRKLGAEMTARVGALIQPYVEYDGIGGIGAW